MKKLIFILASIVCTMILSACGEKEPVIEIDAKIMPISEEEYSKLGGTKYLTNPKKGDFKVFEFGFKMEHNDSVKNRNIEMYEFNDMYEVLGKFEDSYSKNSPRYWHGNWDSQDNESSNTASYHQKFIFYSKGLSEEDIKKALAKELISVSWINDDGEQIRKQYNLSEIVEFTENN